MQLLLNHVVLFLFILSPRAESYKILATITGSVGGHTAIMRRICDILSNRGHEVTLLTGYYYPGTTGNSQTSKTTHLSYTVIGKDDVPADAVEMTEKLTTEGRDDFSMDPSYLPIFFRLMQSGCENGLLNNETLLDHLKSQKFDAIISFTLDLCSVGLSKVLNAPSAQLITCISDDIIASWYAGVPHPASFVTSSVTRYMDRMGFVERAKNLLGHASLRFLMDSIVLDAYTTLYRKRFGEDFPDVRDLLRQTQLYFSNACDPFFELPRPTQANIVCIHGFAMDSPKGLDEDWQAIVEDARFQRVILVTPGTFVKLWKMPQAYRTSLAKMIEKFSDSLFVVKSKEPLEEFSTFANVKIVDWLPQKDLLAHPRVQLLVTHGGYQSLYEAAYFGIPLIMTPMAGEHHANVRRLERLGIGRTIDRNSITPKILIDFVSELLSDEVQRSAKHISGMIQKQPNTPTKNLINWVEFMAEYKTLDVLKPASLKLGWIQYYMIDVLLLFSSIFLLSVIGLIWGIYLCYKTASGKSAKSKNE